MGSGPAEPSRAASPQSSGMTTAKGGGSVPESQRSLTPGRAVEGSEEPTQPAEKPQQVSWSRASETMEGPP